jgi:hypothetical protein
MKRVVKSDTTSLSRNHFVQTIKIPYNKTIETRTTYLVNKLRSFTSSKLFALLNTSFPLVSLLLAEDNFPSVVHIEYAGPVILFKWLICKRLVSRFQLYIFIWYVLTTCVKLTNGYSDLQNGRYVVISYVSPHSMAYVSENIPYQNAAKNLRDHCLELKCVARFSLHLVYFLLKRKVSVWYHDVRWRPTL